MNELSELKAAIVEHLETTSDVLQDTRKDVKALTTEVEKIRAASKNLDDVVEAVERIETRVNRPGAAAVHRAGAGDLDRERRALGVYLKAGDGTELKSMQTQIDPQGGYVVLPAISATMTKRIWDQSPIRRLARVISLDVGDSWQEPIDKGESEAVWVSETQSRPATATPDLSLLTVPLNEIWASQPITQKLLDTSYINLATWIEQKLGEKFGRLEGAAFVTGNGVGRPFGFLSAPTSSAGDFTRAATAVQYVPSGAASLVTSDGLRDLFWSLRAGHRTNAVWLMSSATANAIDKLKFISTGEYIWRDSSTAGAPPTLLGKEVQFCEDMPAIGSGTFPIALADWQAPYVIVDRLGLRLVRDAFTSKPSVLFDAFKRVGGGVANTDALKLLKIGTS